MKKCHLDSNLKYCLCYFLSRAETPHEVVTVLLSQATNIQCMANPDVLSGIQTLTEIRGWSFE